MIVRISKICYAVNWEIKNEAVNPLFTEGIKKPSDTNERGGMPMVTYSDLFQICIFIVALVGLCYQIFKDKRK